MLGVAAGLVLVIRLGVGSRAGFAVLAGSMARGFVMILAGVAAQIALDPLTLAFWIGLAAGWMAVKVAELAIAIPAFSLKQVERA